MVHQQNTAVFVLCVHGWLCVRVYVCVRACFSTSKLEKFLGVHKTTVSV